MKRKIGFVAAVMFIAVALLFPASSLSPSATANSDGCGDCVRAAVERFHQCMDIACDNGCMVTPEECRTRFDLEREACLGFCGPMKPKP